MGPILPVTVILLTGECHVKSIFLFGVRRESVTSVCPVRRESVTSNISHNSGVTNQDTGGHLAAWLESLILYYEGWVKSTFGVPHLVFLLEV